MNLFCLQRDPILAAQDNCNDHCKKMLLEAAQMLANCYTPETLQKAPPNQKGEPRSHSYFNHPVSKFVRASRENMKWTVEHALALESERLKLNYKPHFTVGFLKWVQENIHLSSVPDAPQTDFAIAINKDMNCRKKFVNFDSFDSVTKYRLFYIFDKPFATWTNRVQPEWFRPIQTQADLQQLINFPQ